MEVDVETHEVPGGAAIRVANTGPVISPHEVPLLFEPFRLLTDRVGSAHGSGLGLPIVRAVGAVARRRDSGGAARRRRARRHSHAAGVTGDRRDGDRRDG
jgi:C4-dicarboxylate-specific signal transduction histidine kinase